MINAERGGEASTATCVNTGKYLLVASAGAAIGAIGGALSTELMPVNISLDQDLDIEASFALGKQGLILQNAGDEFSLPNAPVTTNIPEFRGVKLKVKKTEVVQEVTYAFSNPKSIKKFSKLAAQPQSGIVQPIKDGLSTRIAEGAMAGALILPIVGAVAVRRHNPVRRFNQLLSKRGRFLAYPIAALGLVGCGVSGNQIIQEIDDPGKPLPTEIANRSPYLLDATIKGEDLGNAITKVVATFDKGQKDWKIVAQNLNRQIDELADSGELNLAHSDDVETELNETGVLCNVPFTQNILPILQQRLKPDITIDSGDRYTNGNIWPYEHDCEKDVLSTFTRNPFFTAIGNHDPGPDKNSKMAAKINGTTYLTQPDPRSGRWSRIAIKLSQEELEKEIGIQGSIVAEQACDITKKSGIPPDVVVHTPEAGFETILRGCANNISSGHGIRHNDDLNTTRPVFNSYRSFTGQVVQQLINVTASGSKDNVSTYRGPGKDGAVVLKEFVKPNHEFMGAISFIFKKDKTVEIRQEGIPPVTDPSADMINFVAKNSPTAKKVIHLANQP